MSPALTLPGAHLTQLNWGHLISAPSQINKIWENVIYPIIFFAENPKADT